MVKLTQNEDEARRFEESNGEGTVGIFEDTLWETGKLSETAKMFGFSRAYASLVFKKLFKEDFKGYKKERNKIVKPEVLKRRKIYTRIAYKFY